MASQVRPGLTQHDTPRGLQQSAFLIRRRPAYSIRARDLASHSQAGCMGAVSSSDTKIDKETLGTMGASMYGGEHRTTGARSIVIRCHYKQHDLTRKKQIAAVTVLTRYFPLHRTPPTCGYSPLNGLGVHSTSKVPNWLRNAQLCGRPLVKCVASTDYRFSLCGDPVFGRYGRAP